jgi:arginyl-tRNA synthetase
MNIINTIRQSLIACAERYLGINPETYAHWDVSLNTDPTKQSFGDVTTNIALVLSKELKTQPRIIAQRIQEHLHDPLIQDLEIAGPGFINIFLTKEALTSLSRELFEQDKSFFYLDAQVVRSQYLMEFVSANPTGPLHIGHGRGGIIGDVLGNILTFIGHTVTKEFYINDAGSQIQKLGISLKIRCQQQLGIQAELPEGGYQGEYLIGLAQEAVQYYGSLILEQPDSFFAQYGKDHLLATLKKTLEKYGITYDSWFSELTLYSNGSIEKALATLKDNGYIYEKDDALWFTSTKFGDDKDRVVKKKSGELTYVASDIAYLQNKINRGFDHIIIVLGQDHHSYVIRLKAAIAALGYNPAMLDIILYQLVTLKESGAVVRMSKRAGHIITLEDVIDSVGMDVARFFYLNKKADAHLDFDLELALKHTDENPVYYIQYAYVRITSILEKAYQEDIFRDITANDSSFIGNAEKLLLIKIASLKYLLESMSKNYQIHLLTYYVIELAQLFHSYYTINKVIDRNNILQSRGRLCTITLVHRALKLCFDLLGITAPRRM